MERVMGIEKWGRGVMPMAIALLAAGGASGAVAGFTGISATTGATNPVNSTSHVVSYTTVHGQVTGLVGASSVVGGSFETGTSGELVRNFWGAAGSEVDGTDSLLGLDLSIGVLNASVTVRFDQQVTGNSGDANDLFLIELSNFGDDGIIVRPIDAADNLIGTWQLAISDGTWGDSGLGLTFSGDNHSGGTNPMMGVAFDLSDFTGGTGTLTGLWGLAISNTGDRSLDLAVAGYVAAASVPEPSLIFTLAPMVLAMVWRRP